MRKAGAGQTALVDQCVDVLEAFVERGLDSLLPGLGDERDLHVREVREGANVLRRVDHDLLTLERRVEVRHHAHPPGIADPECLRRRLVFPAGVEGAAVELLGRGLGRGWEPRARTTTAAGRHHDPASGQRVFADLGQLLESRRSRSSRGLTRSIGSGRISVEERSELISSIVWR